MMSDEKDGCFIQAGGCLVAIGLFVFSVAVGAAPLLLAIYVANELGWFN